VAENKWVVITTINAPNSRVLEFTKLGYKILIVGDKKTPQDWATFDKGVTYFDYESQEREFPELSSLIGPNTYARKNLGYLYAIKNGADTIWETDDDTFPLKNLIDPLSALSMVRHMTTENEVWNPYSHFLPDNKIWPRGFPLEKVNSSFQSEKLPLVSNFSSVDILQTLVNNEPDVDAVYRLTVNSDPVTFPFKSGAVEINQGIAPGNTQSTFWLTRSSFESIYFPITVSNRFADILKMYLAQVNNNLLYSGFLVEQFRNPHNYMIDFNDEVEMYRTLATLCEFVLKQEFGATLETLYDELVHLSICKPSELQVVKLFSKEISAALNS
jgi:hypothetical protein